MLLGKYNRNIALVVKQQGLEGGNREFYGASI
jgi:hypothetical protein